MLAELVEQVYSLEIIPELARGARKRLERMGYGNVSVQVGDGHLGWPEHAPYDGIVVTAAATHIPRALVSLAVRKFNLGEEFRACAWQSSCRSPMNLCPMRPQGAESGRNYRFCAHAFAYYSAQATP